MSASDAHDMNYYRKCMLGGILSCGLTHTLVCPLDIVKCRMQVSHVYFSDWRNVQLSAVQCFFQKQSFSDFLSLKYLRLAQVCMQVSAEASEQSTLRRAWKDSPSDGYQHWSDTQLKASESSVSMKSSRMSTRVRWAQRMRRNTRP